MKTWKISLTIASVLALVLALVPLASAQPPERPAGFDGPGFHQRGDFHRGGHHRGMRGHDPRFLAEYLDLTEAQQEQARALFEERREAAAPIREQLRAHRQELRELLDTESPDATAVGELVLEGRALREQMRALHESSHDDFRAILTPEQQEKLDNLREARESRRGPRGRRG